MRMALCRAHTYAKAQQSALIGIKLYSRKDNSQQNTPFLFFFFARIHALF